MHTEKFLIIFNNFFVRHLTIKKIETMKSILGLKINYLINSFKNEIRYYTMVSLIKKMDIESSEIKYLIQNYQKKKRFF